MKVSLIKQTQYAPGKTFKCAKRPLISVDGDLGPECGAEVLMHGFHWCAQVCPKCLTNYYASGASRQYVTPSGGYYPPDVAERVRATIAANGGQYVPQF